MPSFFIRLRKVFGRSRQLSAATDSASAKVNFVGKVLPLMV
jgi:hypothetical protein